MSDELDDRIRHLFAEAGRAAPDPPDMPAMVSPAFRWRRWVLVPAVAAAALLVGTTVVLNALGVEIGLGFTASGESAEATTLPGRSDFVMVLADLDLACGDLRESLGSDGAAGGDEAALARLERLEASLGDMVILLEDVAARFPENALLIQVAGDVDRLSDEVAAAIDAGTTGSAERYRTVHAGLASIGADFVELGAVACTGL